jgi:hypothetical protein
MTKLLEKALKAARSLSPAAQDDIAWVVLCLAVLMVKRRCRLPPKTKPRLPHRKPPPLAASLPPMKRCVRFGPNTISEASLYPAGSRRSEDDSRLHLSSLAAGCRAGSTPHSGGHQSSGAASANRPPYERSVDPPNDDTALPQFHLRRGHGDRDNYSRHPTCGSRPVKHAWLRMTRAGVSAVL